MYQLQELLQQASCHGLNLWNLLKVSCSCANVDKNKNKLVNSDFSGHISHVCSLLQEV